MASNDANAALCCTSVASCPAVDSLRRRDDQTVNAPTNDQPLDRNSRLACDLHAHKLLRYRNVRAGALTPRAGTAVEAGVHSALRTEFGTQHEDAAIGLYEQQAALVGHTREGRAPGI